jgi:small subunit ribosomal protein S16
LKLDIARIEHWVGLGAQQSDRVKQLVSTFKKQAAA